MHREIVAVTDRMIEVDHVNGNALDNRRCNLRLCSHAENGCNYHCRSGRRYTSVFKGVSWYKRYGKWVARITVGRRLMFLGYFADERAAAMAYNAAAERLHGAFACLNALAR